MTWMEGLLSVAVLALAAVLLNLQKRRHRRADRTAEEIGKHIMRAMANFKEELNSLEHDCRCRRCGTIERNVVFSITGPDNENWPTCCGMRMVVLAKERTDADV